MMVAGRLAEVEEEEEAAGADGVEEEEDVEGPLVEEEEADDRLVEDRLVEDHLEAAEEVEVASKNVFTRVDATSLPTAVSIFPSCFIFIKEFSICAKCLLQSRYSRL